MLKDKNIIIIGGDKRFSYLFDMLKDRAKNCVIMNTDTEIFVSEYFIKEFDVVILPLPVTKDGIYINSCNGNFRMTIKSVVEQPENLNEYKKVLESRIPDNSVARRQFMECIRL